MIITNNKQEKHPILLYIEHYASSEDSEDAKA